MPTPPFSEPAPAIYRCGLEIASGWLPHSANLLRDKRNPHDPGALRFGKHLGNPLVTRAAIGAQVQLRIAACRDNAIETNFQRVHLVGIDALAAEAGISVTDHYVRMVPPGVPTSGAFMTIRNSGSTDRKLLKVDSPAARTVELHTHVNDNGMLKMRQVKEIDVKAHGQAELKPGSYHIMLIDLKQLLKEGETVPLTLTFDDGSTKKLDAPVKKP